FESDIPKSPASTRFRCPRHGCCTARLTCLEDFVDLHALSFQHRSQKVVLLLEVTENDLDLLLRLHVHLEVMFRTRLGVTALDVLADHDERHQKNLDHVGNE